MENRAAGSIKMLIGLRLPPLAWVTELADVPDLKSGETMGWSMVYG